MALILRLLAAAALLGALTGCAGMMPNWTANSPGAGMQDPPIYLPSPSD